MTALIALPQLAIVETNSPFDEATIEIDGREEDTITIACADARRLAETIVHLVNSVRHISPPPADEAQTPYRSEA